MWICGRNLEMLEPWFTPPLPNSLRVQSYCDLRRMPVPMH